MRGVDRRALARGPPKEGKKSTKEKRKEKFGHQLFKRKQVDRIKGSKRDRVRAKSERAALPKETPVLLRTEEQGAAAPRREVGAAQADDGGDEQVAADAHERPEEPAVLWVRGFVGFVFGAC